MVETSPRCLYTVGKKASVTSEVLPWVWAPTLEFFGAWLNAHILSGELLGFITLYPTASRPEAADP